MPHSFQAVLETIVEQQQGQTISFVSVNDNKT